MQVIVQPASTTVAPGGGVNPPTGGIWHPQVHVEGQSESALHGPVDWAKHEFHETLVHVLPASQMEGKEENNPESPAGSTPGGLGTSLHGITVSVAYGGSLASGCWSFPQLMDPANVSTGQVYPGPQSEAATQGVRHWGTQAPHVPPSARAQTIATSHGRETPYPPR